MSLTAAAPALKQAALTTGTSDPIEPRPAVVRTDAPAVAPDAEPRPDARLTRPVANPTTAGAFLHAIAANGVTVGQGPGIARSPFDVSALPSPVRERLQKLGVTIANDGRIRHANSEEDLGILAAGRDTRFSATLAANGDVTLTANNGDAGSSSALIDTWNRRVVTTDTPRDGVPRTSSAPLPYSALEAFSVWSRVEAGERGAESFGRIHTVQGASLPGFSTLFAGFPPSVLRDMPYMQLNHALGPNNSGMTFFDRAFVSPGRNGGPAEQSTISNELSSVAWFRRSEEVLRATYAPVPFNGPSVDERVAFQNRINDANYFEGFPQERGLTIERNIQANELVSDAASLAADPREIERILGHASMYSRAVSDPDSNYYATARFARAIMQRINEARPENARVDIEAASQLAPPYRMQALNLSPSELHVFASEYMRVGAALNVHYDAELRRRFPPHSWRR